MGEWKRTLVAVGVLVLVTGLVLGGVFLFQGGPRPQASVTPSPQTLAVRQAAPDYRGLDVDGNPVSLKLLKGQPVWLLFQATWCSNCRAEIADVKAAAQEQGVTVVAVYLQEDKDLVTDYVSRLALADLTNVPDPNSAISSAYGVSSVPTHFFIDTDGVLRSVKKGALTADAMTQELGALK